VLHRNPHANLKVFVIWEPVLATDWGRPGPAQTAYVPDPRAEHFWDPASTLSAQLGGPAKLEALASTRKVAFRMKNIIWDTALVYPPGAHWGDPATLLIAPLVKFRDDLANGLTP